VRSARIPNNKAVIIPFYSLLLVAYHNIAQPRIGSLPFLPSLLMATLTFLYIACSFSTEDFSANPTAVLLVKFNPMSASVN